MKSMLVLDGSEIFSRLFADIFEKRGWNVVTCADRECAIEHLAGAGHYDAILLGYRVPGTTGVQLVRLIRSLEHRNMTAVVMVTDNAELTDEALAAGRTKSCSNPLTRTPWFALWISTSRRHGDRAEMPVYTRKMNEIV